MSCEEGTDIGLSVLLEALDKQAEGYVYVIKLRRSDEKLFYYVGSVTSGIDGLKKRMRSHERLNGECSAPVRVNGREVLLGKRDDVRKGEYEFVGVEEIEPVYNDEKRHIRELERKKAVEVAFDRDTTNVLGGK